MPTLLFDLRDEPRDFGPALFLLDEAREAGRLRLVPQDTDGRPAPPDGLDALARAAEAALRRDRGGRWDALVLVRQLVGSPSLTNRWKDIGAGLVAPLVEVGLAPRTVRLMVLDTVSRQGPHAEPIDPAAQEAWLHDCTHLVRALGEGPRKGTVLRLPVRESPGSAYQADLVRMVYVLGALVENPADPFRAPHAYCLNDGTMRSVVLETEGVESLVRNYAAKLTAVADSIEHRTRTTPAVDLSLAGQSEVSCPSDLDTFDPGSPSFALLRRIGDRRSWGAWTAEVGAKLAAYEAKADAAVVACVDRFRVERVPRQVVSVENLRERIAEEERAITAIDAEEAAMIWRARTDDKWAAVVARHDDKVRNLILDRPGPRPATVIVGFGALVGAVPWLFAPSSAAIPPPPGFGPLGTPAGWWMLTTLGVVLVLLAHLVWVRIALRNAVRAVGAEAGVLARGIQTALDERLNAIERRRRREAAEQNIQSLRLELDRIGGDKVRLAWHVRALKERAEAARQFAGALDLGWSPHARTDYKLPAVWAGHAPPYRDQEVYRFPDPQRLSVFEIVVGNRRTEGRRHSLLGLSAVRFQSDPMVSVEPLASEPPESAARDTS